MAYSITDQGNWSDSDVKTAFCDYSSDLTSIPTDNLKMGSMAIVIHGGATYILDSSKTWVRQSASEV